MNNISSYELKKIYEKAYDINYQVKKGFQHCRDAVIYDENGKRLSGYMVMNLAIGCYVPGCYNECYDYLWDFDDVIEFLKKQYAIRELDW